jgi:multidrug resistance efflux pump
MRRAQEEIAFQTWWSWPPHPYVRSILWQWTIWGLALAVCVPLLWLRSSSPKLSGLARGRIAQLSVPFAVRVKAVPVELFQKVQQGDVVALLDDSVLQAQIATIEAEIVRLRAEHAETQGLIDADTRDRLTEWDAEQRAFDNDTVQLVVTLQEAKADLEYDRALLEGLRANAARLEALVQRGHTPSAELELARAEAEATARKVRERELLVANLQAQETAAAARRTAFRDRRPVRPSVAEAQEHLTEAIAVQQGLRQELEAQRAQCVLRAPFDGSVIVTHLRTAEATAQRPGEGILPTPGDVVNAGEPVVTIVADRPTEIVAYATEQQSSGLDSGREVVLTTLGAPQQIASARIATVSSTIEILPERLWRNQLPEWGRPFIVPIPPGMRVTTGDRVGVKLQ